MVNSERGGRGQKYSHAWELFHTLETIVKANRSKKWPNI